MIAQQCNTELSVVIPCLDEESMLPALFASLSLQRAVTFEVIISDGGSLDGTCRAAEELAAHYRLPLTLVTGAQGRGCQLEAGAAAVKGGYILFLHADSSFADPYALKKGLDALSGHHGKPAAAKFRLRFHHTSSNTSRAYYYYESKATLLRRECSHGDQGLMMHRDTFRHFGPFAGFPPMLSETRLAEKILLDGLLLTIPADIFTSARRFEREGLYQRQVVNAILMNCANQGWDEPFRAVTDLYRNQSDTGRLQLSGVLETMKQLIAALPREERRRFWRTTGAYVRENAWQLAFLIDVQKNFRGGLPPGTGVNPILDRFDRVVAPKLDCRTCDRITTVLVWLWFNLARLSPHFHE